MSKIETQWLPVDDFGFYICKHCPVLTLCNRKLYFILPIYLSLYDSKWQPVKHFGFYFCKICLRLSLQILVRPYIFFDIHGSTILNYFT